MARWGAGIHAASAGDAAGARHQPKRLRSKPIARLAALDRFDAAVRAHDLPLAEQWLEDLAVFATATRWAWADAQVAYGRALLAEPADAPARFDTALRHLAGPSGRTR